MNKHVLALGLDTWDLLCFTLESTKPKNACSARQSNMSITTDPSKNLHHRVPQHKPSYNHWARLLGNVPVQSLQETLVSLEARI